MSKSVIIKKCSPESNSDPESPHDFSLDAVAEAIEKLFACGEDSEILKKYSTALKKVITITK